MRQKLLGLGAGEFKFQPGQYGTIFLHDGKRITGKNSAQRHEGNDFCGIPVRGPQSGNQHVGINNDFLHNRRNRERLALSRFGPGGLDFSFDFRIGQGPPFFRLGPIYGSKAAWPLPAV
jgi:hypothetical protein